MAAAILDLAFYNGNSFRVAINGSVFMALAELDEPDIDAVNSVSVAEIQAGVAVRTFDPVNTAFDSDQRVIGSNWRNGGGPGTLPSLKEDVFFVLEDADGNNYKLKFTALVDESGVRGYPAFEYALLQ